MVCTERIFIPVPSEFVRERIPLVLAHSSSDGLENDLKRDKAKTKTALRYKKSAIVDSYNSLVIH